MHISDMIGQMGGQYSSGNKKISSEGNARNISKTTSDSSSTSMSALKPGQVFEGSVSDINGNKVTLSLSDGQKVSARIEGDVSIQEGQSVFFEVQSNENGTVKIKPMMDDNFSNPVLKAALKQANLSINEDNLNFVKQMMDNGESINANNLGRMFRAHHSNPSVDLSTLIKMDNMGLKLTSDNIQNFNRLENNTNALLKETDNIISSIKDLINDDSVSAQDILRFEDALLSSLKSDYNNESSEPVLTQVSSENISDTEALNPESIPGGENTKGENLINDLAGKEVVIDNSEAKKVMDETTSVKADMESSDFINPNKEINQETKADSNVLKTDINQPENVETIMTRDRESIQSAGKTDGNSTVSKGVDSGISKNDSVRTDLQEDISRLPMFKEKHPEYFDEKGNLKAEADLKQVMKDALNHIKNNPEISPEKIKDFFSGKGYNKALSAIMKNDWIIKPEQVAEKDAVKELYKNLEKQLDTVDKIAKSVAGNDNPVSNTVNQAKGNVDFMNQINQLYSYVQIPLKMMNQNATGDLYVYTDRHKKGGKGNSDTLSAFIHLSLENLGDTDVAVKMNKKAVEINFFMDNDISYRLIRDNSHLLVERLETKGYNAKIDITKDREEQNPLDKFLEQRVNKSAQGNDFKRFSFDVRA